MTVMVNQTGHYHFYSSNLVLILTMNQSLFRGQICHDRCPFYLSAACFLPLTSLPCVAGSNKVSVEPQWGTLIQARYENLLSVPMADLLVRTVDHCLVRRRCNRLWLRRGWRRLQSNDVMQRPRLPHRGAMVTPKAGARGKTTTVPW